VVPVLPDGGSESAMADVKTAVVDHTPELLDELERLEREATPGPWERRGEPFDRHAVLDARQTEIADGPCERRHDLNLIAALRNAAPALLSTARLASARLAEVRRLREVLPKLRRGHDSDCGVREDDGYVRCTCGAIATNALIDAALSGGETTK
jgi:hypothetical protein